MTTIIDSITYIPHFISQHSLYLRGESRICFLLLCLHHYSPRSWPSSLLGWTTAITELLLRLFAASISQGCCNKLSRTARLKTINTYFTVLNAQKNKTKVMQGWFFPKAPREDLFLLVLAVISNPWPSLASGCIIPISACFHNVFPLHICLVSTWLSLPRGCLCPNFSPLTRPFGR